MFILLAFISVALIYRISPNTELDCKPSWFFFKDRRERAKNREWWDRWLARHDNQKLEPSYLNNIILPRNVKFSLIILFLNLYFVNVRYLNSKTIRKRQLEVHEFIFVVACFYQKKKASETPKKTSAHSGSK